MDPNTALKDILDDLSREDREEHREEVLQNLWDLCNWVRDNGFLPRVEKVGQSYKVKA